jgi:hypothetical protein
MLFSRLSPRRISRHKPSARPTLEKCEQRQLLSGIQAGADLTVFRKHVPDAAPAAVGTMAAASAQSSTNVTIKHSTI